MEMPTVFGEQKFKKRKGTNIKKGHIKKVSCLDDIVIEKLEKPHTLKDFSLSSYSQSYCLTLENIKQARYVDYQGMGGMGGIPGMDGDVGNEGSEPDVGEVDVEGEE